MNLVARQLVLALDCGIIQDLEHQDSTLNIDTRRPGALRIALPTSRTISSTARSAWTFNKWNLEHREPSH
jgi:hypothetical protein